MLHAAADTSCRHCASRPATRFSHGIHTVSHAFHAVLPSSRLESEPGTWFSHVNGFCLPRVVMEHFNGTSYKLGTPHMPRLFRRRWAFEALPEVMRKLPLLCQSFSTFHLLPFCPFCPSFGFKAIFGLDYSSPTHCVDVGDMTYLTI